MVAMTVLAIAAALTVARAQTFSACDPSKKDCSPVPAIGRTVTCDFTKGKCDHFQEREGTDVKYDDEDGVQFIIGKDTDSPTISTSEFMLFGRLEVELKAMPGPGLITSVVMQSDYLDEIDIQWVGKNDDEVQSNYFAKGDDLASRSSGIHAASEVTGSFNNYTIVWTARSISWAINGKEYRVEGRNPSDKGDTYPQTPSRILLGAWVAGRRDVPEGTIEWGGGMADFSDGPHTAYVRSITITDYGGGDEVPKKRVKEYESTNRNGTYQSIRVVETDEDNEDPSDTTSGTSSPTPSSGVGSPGGSSENEKDGSSKGGLSSGAIAGIVVGSIAAVALALVAAFLSWRRRRGTTGPGGGNGRLSATELHGKSFEGWKEGHHPPAEMDGMSSPQEIDSRRAPVELETSHAQR